MYISLKFVISYQHYKYRNHICGYLITIIPDFCIIFRNNTPFALTKVITGIRRWGTAWNFNYSSTTSYFGEHGQILNHDRDSTLFNFTTVMNKKLTLKSQIFNPAFQSQPILGSTPAHFFYFLTLQVPYKAMPQLYP